MRTQPAIFAVYPSRPIPDNVLPVLGLYGGDICGIYAANVFRTLPHRSPVKPANSWGCRILFAGY